NDEAILKLIDLSNLNTISISNNQLSKKIEPIFEKMKSLKHVYINNTSIDNSSLLAWQKKYPGIKFYFQDGHQEMIELTPPILLNEKFVIAKDDSIFLKQVINGAVIKYTLDKSEPDSTHGLIYQEPIAIEKSTMLKAISIKEGWKKSPKLSAFFFEKGSPPNEVKLFKNANTQYPGTGASTLINSSLGPIGNLKDQNWIAFREESFGSTFTYPVTKKIKTIVFSYGVQIPAYVFPPVDIKVYGSNDNKNFKLLKSVKLETILPKDASLIKSDLIEISLTNAEYKHFKIEANNLKSIPNWHSGKGEKAWLFIDEIFFYE
ncbi:MAG: hypothetical protein RLZZ546_471, partial [Bacteroidota bacterium]